MQASATEYKRWKRESQVQKISYKIWTQQSKKMQNAKTQKVGCFDPNSKHPGNIGHNEKPKPKNNRYR